MSTREEREKRVCEYAGDSRFCGGCPADGTSFCKVSSNCREALLAYVQGDDAEQVAPALSAARTWRNELAGQIAAGMVAPLVMKEVVEWCDIPREAYNLTDALIAESAKRTDEMQAVNAGSVVLTETERHGLEVGRLMEEVPKGYTVHVQMEEDTPTSACYFAVRRRGSPLVENGEVIAVGKTLLDALRKASQKGWKA